MRARKKGAEERKFCCKLQRRRQEARNCRDNGFTSERKLELESKAKEARNCRDNGFTSERKLELESKAKKAEA